MKTMRPLVAIVGGEDVDLRLDLMSRLRDSYDLVAVGSNPALGARFEAAGFRYYLYPLARGWSFLSDVRSLRLLRRLFREIRPDVVHAFATKPTVWARIAADLEHVPVIVGTIPGLGNLYTLNDVGTRAGRAVYEVLQRSACRRSDLTVFQNQADRERFTRDRICAPDKADIVAGSGVRTDVFDRERVSGQAIATFREDVGAGPDSVVVTMIARVTRSKGALDFADAAELCAEDDHIRFVLVGPNDRQSLDRLGDSEIESVQRAVTWLGRREDIPAILAGSEVFVLPSYYREGIPRVLLEAASMGLPLVAVDGPGAREVVSHGANGFLVPPRDPQALAAAVRSVAADPFLRQRLGMESRRVALDSFDIGVVAQATHEQYGRLLESAAVRIETSKGDGGYERV
jgi:glycosyltransferase involved in cell wall biosynthesis